ncbi:MAG: RidA family protein [Proteobacteria bacterium]|nr:RidA family protein [Pseudomonadota bacterium]
MKNPIIPTEFAHYYDKWHFSPGVESNGLVFFSGVTASRKDKEISTNAEEQFHDVFFKLKVYLHAADLSFDDILEMTTYHIDLKKHFNTFSKVKDQYIKKPFPAWTAVGVSELIADNALVEIRVIAKKKL